ncbi:MAG: shikimate kinase [Clostridia bacterium]|nr:shikimate kinase [Clostridia bacterium]
MNKSNVVLVGMPGAGKSTIGVLLAKTLKMTFIDTDLLIQQKEDRFLQDIIDTNGIKEFLKLEENVVLDTKLQNHVIATGGSVIYSSIAIRHLKEDGVLVYLKLDYDEIQKRITNITSRGIAMQKDQSLQDIYIERTPLYEEHADITINCSGKHMEEIVADISRILQKEPIFNKINQPGKPTK